MVETAPVAKFCISFVTLATSDKKSVPSPTPDNKLSKLEDTFPTKLSAQASAATSVTPKVDEADILSSPGATFLVTGDSAASAVFSPDSFAFSVPLGGAILSVYPVNFQLLHQLNNTI